MKKRCFRIGRSLFMLFMAFCLITADLAPVLAVTQADIDALKKDAAELNTRKKELEQQLDALADDKAEILARRKLLDQQVANTSAQIQNVEAQIAEYSALITQTEEELAEAERQEAEQYDLFCQRVRAMEEQGTVDYWSVLFRATSFSDLLGRLDIVNEIMEYDQRVIDDLKKQQEEIAARKADLETQKADSEAAKATLLSQKTEMDEQRSAANELVKQLQADTDEARAEMAAVAAEEEALLAQAVRLSREVAAQQAAAGQPSSAALGGYIWPVTSRRITSQFGPRNTGIKGASTNHKGVDIGGVGYNSEVRAAKAGTVIISSYSSSYGNYVSISHGSGNTTVYAHLSSRKVSVGQRVDQGQLIGITGSTGISSGPHLHFEIMENGARINPLKYLKGYVLA